MAPTRVGGWIGLVRQRQTDTPGQRPPGRKRDSSGGGGDNDDGGSGGDSSSDRGGRERGPEAGRASTQPCRRPGGTTGRGHGTDR